MLWISKQDVIQLVLFRMKDYKMKSKNSENKKSGEESEAPLRHSNTVFTESNISQ